ncbi:uncharacterized protein LOC128547781 [Mercenaria mercenaria]|uniref:uncharacterized protein LOC128547781 n=1 Tax=Mercenaria mercenaria TaxID=6596 RepID=UPI00234F3E7C|nr:uncharacterized protein LOC128547781 [Mercenaria mercenaria]
MKYVVQSRKSGEVRCLFNFEVFEKYTSTYKEINEFFKNATGIGLDENLDFLDDELDEIEMETVNSAISSLEPTTAEPEPQDLEQPNKKFKSASESDITRLKAQNTERTTDSSTKWAVGLLKAWMSENEYLNESFEDLDPTTLDTLLQQFYACLQSRKGGNYSKSALVGIRAGINCHLTAPPFSRLLNLMKDREFMASNQVLTGLIKGLKREGKDISKNKEPISEEDHIKLYESGVFSEHKPETLQNKVMYEIIAQFGRRGREGLQTLKKELFVIKKDVKDRRYLTMAYNEADKTHHGLDSREKSKEPRMYETGDDFCPLKSPLKSFEKYLSKLHPQCERLFQRPQRVFAGPESETWFENSPLGVNKINGFMARLSEAAKLSQRYTNHCVRAFVSTHLSHKGFSNEAIMAVTGHRNVQSLTSYIKPHDDGKHNLSNALTYKSRNSSEVKPYNPVSSVVVPEPVVEIETSEPKDQLQSLDQCSQLQVASSSSTSVSSVNHRWQ